MDAQISDEGFWYVAEATAADAVDDVMLEIGPMFDGDTVPAPTTGLAPMQVSHDWPSDERSVDLDFRVTSFDIAENAEVRCSVYFEGQLVVEDVAVGGSPVAECTGEFERSDFE